ncbi:MAG: hypothetical protein PSV16_08245 [Flavobacterium sp.]|nr:hypothetical protein [Flavobacterium sp.]
MPQLRKAPGVVVNGERNDVIIKEIVTLDLNSVTKLIAMLSHPGTDKGFNVMCFEPHQSILIYKNGICLLIDVCFHCMGFTGSKTLDFSSGLLRSEKDWANLEAFLGNGVFNMKCR